MKINSLIPVVLGFYHGDKEQTIKLIDWIGELCPNQHIPFYLVTDPHTSTGGIMENTGVKILGVVRSLFGRKGWPQGPNELFDCAARAFKDGPFFWIEPDCTPITSDWYEKIIAEYKSCGKPFWGNHVITPDGHELMNGVGIYPANLEAHHHKFFLNQHIPWDAAAGKYVVPRMFRTNLIQHEWRGKNFAARNSLQRLKPETVMHHGCKDDTLIKKLKRKGYKIQKALTQS